MGERIWPRGKRRVLGEFQSLLKVMGVVDTQRSKDKGYETIVKEGLCDEFTLTGNRPELWTWVVRQLDELRMVYEQLPEFLNQFSEDGEDKMFFYRTAKTKELDNLFGDIYHKILDMERAIIRDLVTRILHFEPHLIKAVNFAAELDCFLSLAIIARQNNYVRPILTEDSQLDIQNGRHVLQELTVDTFVPNDTKIFNDGRINIITGPNYSGKSIYVKQKRRIALVKFFPRVLQCPSTNELNTPSIPRSWLMSKDNITPKHLKLRN
ncbi:hypothetical protein HPP92_001589 [Vanilla planifolia]|uniref:Uncharacterized protein n=1 Tax=Vanilla planifolia TaxID=51239 RepID=A0A835VH30_VANPL|nr:hypothetical protein HPP92_001589 [Vanilla planifolia]